MIGHCARDAARNAEHILRAARSIYAERGPDASIDTIAARAGIGERTLYRRFPSKAALIRATLDLIITEKLTPAIEQAACNPDALAGLAALVEAAVSIGASEHHLLDAGRKAGALTNISWRSSTEPSAPHPPHPSRTTGETDPDPI